MSDSDLIKSMLLDALERGTQTVEALEESVARDQRLQEMGLGNDEHSQATVAALETWQRWQGGAA
jgi:hypothetical protein